MLSVWGSGVSRGKLRMPWVNCLVQPYGPILKRNHGGSFCEFDEALGTRDALCFAVLSSRE